MKHRITTSLLALLATCGVPAFAASVLPTEAPSAPASAPAPAHGAPTPDPGGLDQALDLINAGNPLDAIKRILDGLVARGEARYARANGPVYCAHTHAESVAYAALGIVTTTTRNVTLADGDWADAIFLRGYAEFDLGDFAAAQRDYERALALSPRWPHFLSELGELHLRQRDWTGALDLFAQARDNAPEIASPDRVAGELARALRGIGYADVELGRLDEAEAMYRRCLEIDPNDEKARNELGYVLGLKQKQAA